VDAAHPTEFRRKASAGNSPSPVSDYFCAAIGGDQSRLGRRGNCWRDLRIALAEGTIDPVTSDVNAP